MMKKYRKGEPNRKNESYSDYLVRHKGDKSLTGVQKGDQADVVAARKKATKKEPK